MERRHIELQLRAVLVTYRIEFKRRDSATMETFRARALSLLDGLGDEITPYPDLQAALRDARREMDGAEMPPTAATDRDVETTEGT